MLRVKCPTCQAQLKIGVQHAGKKKPCVQCGQKILIPSPPRNKTVLGEILDPDQPPEPYELELVEEPQFIEVEEQTEESVPDLLTRCFYCGQVVAVSQTCRRKAKTGESISSSYHSGGGYFSSGGSTTGHYDLVDLCHPCTRSHDDAEATRRIWNAVKLFFRLAFLALLVAGVIAMYQAR